MRAEAVGALHGLYVGASGVPSEAAFDALILALGDRLARFRRVWVTDSAGVVLHQAAIGLAGGGGEGSIPLGTDVDLATPLGVAERAAQARRTRRVVVSRPGTLYSGAHGFVVLEPIYSGGLFRGFVGGTVATGALRAALLGIHSTPPAGQLGLVVVADSAGRDTVVAVDRGEGRASARTFRAPVPLPGGGAWFTEVRYSGRSAVRLQLWGVALAALGALIVGGWHERRQTRRIADRSRELEHLSQELLRANRAKSEFLANVSHELRTPLNAIVGFTELLRGGVYGELAPRQAGPVARIEASAAHLRLLVDQVLDLAKIAAGRMEVQAEALDLRQFVLDVATEIEPLLAERGLAFSLAMGAAIPRIRTDPTHLRQILVNLLGNAVKFTPAGGITVRTRLVTPGMIALGLAPPALAALASRDNGTAALGAGAPEASTTWVTLQVADTGIGIAPRDHARVFDEFEQLGAGARGDSDARGTGLGLAISRRLARLLGGDLTLDSAPGKGSTFTVWIPLGERRSGEYLAPNS